MRYLTEVKKVDDYLSSPVCPFCGWTLTMMGDVWACNNQMQHGVKEFILTDTGPDTP